MISFNFNVVAARPTQRPRDVVLLATLLIALAGSGPSLGAAPGQLRLQGLRPEEVVTIAAGLVAAGELEQGGMLLRQLERDGVGGEEREFQQGMLALAAHDYVEAERRFRAMLDHDPSLVRVRLELARTLFLRRDDSAADYHFRLALARDPPAEVVATVNLFRQEIRRRRAWRLDLGLAIAPDTNINGATGKQSIAILGQPFQLDNEGRARSGVGLAINTDASYRFRGTTITPIYVGGYQRSLRYGNGDFNDEYLGAEVGPEFFLPVGRLRATATASRRWYGNEPYQDALGVRLLLDLPVTLRWSLSGSLDLRENAYARNIWQDGREINFGLTASRTMGPRTMGDIWSAVNRSTAREAAYASRAMRLGVGISHEFPHAVRLGVGAEITRIEYDERLAIFSAARQDWRSILSASLVKPDWAVIGFAPSLRLSYALTRSTVELHESDRWRLEVGFVKAL